MSFDTYIPDMDEIWQTRTKVVGFMRIEGWDDKIIDDVMFNDNPEPRVVLSMARRLGWRRTYKIIKEMNDGSDG